MGTSTVHPASSRSLTEANPIVGRNRSTRQVTNRPMRGLVFCSSVNGSQSRLVKSKSCLVGKCMSSNLQRNLPPIHIFLPKKSAVKGRKNPQALLSFRKATAMRKMSERTESVCIMNEPELRACSCPATLHADADAAPLRAPTRLHAPPVYSLPQHR